MQQPITLNRVLEVLKESDRLHLPLEEGVSSIFYSSIDGVIVRVQIDVKKPKQNRAGKS